MPHRRNKGGTDGLARDPAVLRAALVRFGCCMPAEAPGIVSELRALGRTTTESGHQIRMVAFGSTRDERDDAAFTFIPLGHIVRFQRCAQAVGGAGAMAGVDTGGSGEGCCAAHATHDGGHTAAAELLRSDTPDFRAYEERLREGAEHMVRAHVNMARAAVQARQVLTSDQRSRLETLMPMGGMGMMHGGEQGATTGMAGMMMACPMMGAGRQAPAAHRH